MASREHQGLQIALISFVMLTIVFGVISYWQFTARKEAEDKQKRADATTTELTAAKAKVDTDLTDALNAAGFKSTAEIKDEINTKYAPAMGLTSLPDDGKNLKKVLDMLSDTIKTKEDSVAAIDAKNRGLQTQLAQQIDAAEKKLKVVTADRDAAAEELKKERLAYNDASKEQSSGKEQLVKEKADKNKAMDELKSIYERKIAEQNAKLAEAQKNIAKLQGEIKKYYVLDSSAQGAHITWVSEREHMTYINLGTDDGLLRRITFSVYAPGVTDVSKATPKGKIEVVNVTGPKIAEARIVDSIPNDPILPGDLIHTQGWHPGQHEHFAIAGLIDIDGLGTGIDQTAKLHDLIVANGGFVDAELVDAKDKDGKQGVAISGRLNVNTRYLIVGDPKPDTPGADKRMAASTELIRQAERLGIQQIGLTKFLSMMGYTPHSGPGGVTTNGAAKPGDNAFRPRQPPARAKDDSAF